MENIYSKKYDYDDIKIAACCVDFIHNVKSLNYPDYEELAQLVVFIKKSYNKNLKRKTLSFEEEGYIQKYAYNFLNQLTANELKNILKFGRTNNNEK